MHDRRAHDRAAAVMRQTLTPGGGALPAGWGGTLRSVLAVPERWPGRTLMAIGVTFALAYGASLALFPKPDGRILVGDAVHHYVYLRSFVFDGDIHFRNDYVRLYRLDGTNPETDWVYDRTVTGQVRNLMPVGPALLWAPAFLATTAAIWLASLLGAQYPLDGFARAFQASAGFSGILAATLGCWFAYRAAAQMFGARIAIWSVLTIWLSSSTIYYSLISPAYSHAASMLAVSLAWFVWMTSLERQSVRRYFWVGTLCGVAALMRWQDATLLLLPLIDACWHRRDGLRAWLTRLMAASAGATLAFTPQMLVWMTLYGKPLAIPQGAAFMRWTEPALWQVLFSVNHGLMSWTPVIACAVVGLLLAWRRAPLVDGIGDVGSGSRSAAPAGQGATTAHTGSMKGRSNAALRDAPPERHYRHDRYSPLVMTAALAFVAASWYVNAAVADWWAGEAFGSRRFVSCLPMFVIGFAALLERVAAPLPVIATVTAAFATHTLLLLGQYQAYMHGLRQVVAYPAGDLLWARFRAPFDLLAWWWQR